MPHDISLIAILAVGFGLALIFGYLANLLKMPPLMGYLIAGILIGPSTPGFQADMGLATQLAEIGVMLLMFGVGLHFSLQDLMSVRKIAIPGAIFQILAAVVLGGAVALFWGWSIEAALVFGLSLSVASTVVLLKALESRGILDSANGRIAVGWLVVEDLVMVLVLVLLPVAHEFLSDASGNAASLSDIGQSIAVTLTKVTAFIVLMLIVGKRVLPKTLWLVAKSGSRELFTLSVVAIAIGVAFGAAKLFDVSFALGAFFAGMMMRESEFSHRAADESLPLRDAFAVLFFVSVGMLFDPQILINEPLKLLIVAAIIMIGKTIAAIALVLAFRYPLNTAMTVGASLAQIGEFSFILAGMGLAMNMLPAEGYSLILAGALISIAANSLTFYTISPAIEWAKKNSEFARKLDLRDDPLAQLPMSTHHDLLNGQVVVVGYGRVGRHIAARLQAENISVVIAEQSREVVENLRKNNQPAVCGDASDPAVLIQAHIARAAFLIIAVKDAVGIPQMVETARTLNPSIQILIRANTDEDAELFTQEGLGDSFTPEKELAETLANTIITRRAAAMKA